MIEEASVKLDPRFNEQRNDAVARMLELTGVDEAKATQLIDAALEGAIEQTLETINGSSNVPTAMTQSLAERLFYIAKQIQRLPTLDEIEVLFRTTPASARTIRTNTTAIYTAPIRTFRVARVRAETEVFESQHDGLDGYELVAPDDESMEMLEDQLARLGMTSLCYRMPDPNRVWIPRLHDKKDTLGLLDLEQPAGTRQERQG